MERYNEETNSYQKLRKYTITYDGYKHMTMDISLNSARESFEKEFPNIVITGIYTGWIV